MGLLATTSTPTRPEAKRRSRRKREAAMKKTTTYTQTLIITTDDDGNRTATRTHHAGTYTEYLFSELSPEAQERAISDAIAEEVDNAWIPCSQIYFATEDILDAAHDLQKSQPIEIEEDQGCSWYGTARGTCPWAHHSPDWQAVTEAKDTGICYSMDICDAWNAYAARIVALQEAYEEAEDKAWTYYEAADATDDRRNYDDITDDQRDALRAVAEAERSRAAFYEDMAERIEAAAEELTEEAAQAVGSIVDGLICEAWTYYQSPDFWREWLDDGEARFTREGERII